tara:strand:+ start:108 stop:554 length:447 start_codon:yes stop_codon:yes gene_type:complete
MKSTTFDSKLISLIMLMGTILILGFIILLISRFQRGIIGIVLVIIAILFFVYWIKEFRKTISKSLNLPIQPIKKEFIFDLIEDKDITTIIADVPGPKPQIKVDIKDTSLHIIGGMNFKKEIDIGNNKEIINIKYINGTLTVKLKTLKI